MRIPSLSIKLVSAFAVFVLVPAYMMLLVFYQQYRESLDAKVRDYTTKSFEQVHQLVGGRLFDLVRVSNLIVFNPQVEAILAKRPAERDWEYHQDLELIDHLFVDAQNAAKVANIYFTLAAKDGRVFGNWPSLPGAETVRSDWYRKASESAPFPEWLSPHASFLTGAGSGSAMISMVRSMEGDHGVLRISIEQSAVSQWLQEVKNEWTTLVYNQEGELIYGDDGPLPGPLRAQLQEDYADWNSVSTDHRISDGYRIISRGLPLKGWTIVQVLNEADLYHDIRFLTRGFTLVSFLLLLVFVGITIAVTHRLMLPLKRMKWAMKRVGEGNWHTNIPQETRDEVGQIAFHFNQMVAEIRGLIGRLQEEERMKSQLYYESLLAQVNPHFLFNTLSSIKWTATISGAHHVADLLTSLGKILEMSTKRVDDWITLEQEIDYVRHYMNLQYARFGERVQVRTDVPDALRKARIPKFIVQPLVENAILHGFEQHEIRGEIAIEARAERGQLTLFVADNGKGFSHERLRALFGDLPAGGNRYSGIGIRNVQERIQLMCGRRCGLMFCSVEGESTVVRAALPLDLAKEEQPAHV